MSNELPDIFGTKFYRKALYTPGTILVQPSGLVKGLADTLPQNVTLYEETTITAIEYEPEIVLHHATGRIKAKKLILGNNAFGTTCRRTHDNRILIRNSFSFNENGRYKSGYTQKYRESHRLSFKRRFPTLKDVNFEHTWGGGLGMTRNGSSLFGELRKNVYGALGCNGLGTVRCTAMGTMLAGWLAGKRNDTINYLLSLPKPEWNPPDPLSRTSG